MTDKKTFKGFPLDSRGDVIGAFPTVDVIQERTKDLMNEVTGNINQMTIDYCLKFNIDPDVLIKQKAEIELLQMKIADIKANCDLAIEGRDIKIKELEKGCEETQELLDKQIEATYKLDKENEELNDEVRELKLLVSSLVYEINQIWDINEMNDDLRMCAEKIDREVQLSKMAEDNRIVISALGFAIVPPKPKLDVKEI